MKRRWVFPLFALLSLLACLATGVVWVRSGLVEQGITLERFSYVPTLDESERPIFKISLVDYVLTVHAGQIRLTETRSADDMVIFAEGLWAWSAEHTPGWSVRTTQPTTATPVNQQVSIDRFKFFWSSWDVEGLFAGSVAYGSRSVGVPAWFVILLSGVLPAMWLILASRRFRRRRRNACGGCGYDLRASVGRCPECGEAAPPMREMPQVSTASHPRGRRAASRPAAPQASIASDPGSGVKASSSARFR